jgi:hypothetical protein
VANSQAGNDDRTKVGVVRRQQVQAPLDIIGDFRGKRQKGTFYFILAMSGERK